MFLKHNVTSVEHLMAAHTSGYVHNVRGHDGKLRKNVRVTKIEAEDGSGWNFNITLSGKGKEDEVLYFRCNEPEGQARLKAKNAAVMAASRALRG